MPAPRTRAFTLIEMILVIALLGLAGAMVIPSMGSVGGLRVQAALRTIVSDITFAQSDAIAFQEKRAIVFDVTNNQYSVLAVPGSEIDIDTQMMFDPTKPQGRYQVSFTNPQYGGARITRVAFNGSESNTTLVFDDMGGPLVSAASDQASTGGVITVQCPTSTWDIVIEPFTGRVTVRKTAGE